MTEDNRPNNAVLAYMAEWPPSDGDGEDNDDRRFRDIEKRLSQVEKEVSELFERTEHCVTKADVQSILNKILIATGTTLIALAGLAVKVFSLG